MRGLMKILLALYLGFFTLCFPLLIPEGEPEHGFQRLVYVDEVWLRDEDQRIFEMCIDLWIEFEDTQIISLVLCDHLKSQMLWNVKCRLNRLGIPA